MFFGKCEMNPCVFCSVLALELFFGCHFIPVIFLSLTKSETCSSLNVDLCSSVMCLKYRRSLNFFAFVGCSFLGRFTTAPHLLVLCSVVLKDVCCSSKPLKSHCYPFQHDGYQ